MQINIFDNWIVKINRNLEINKSKINPRDYVFFNIEMIRKAANHTVKFFKTCSICDENRQELVSLSEEFPQLINTISGRRQFTNRLDKILTHLKKQHKIYPKGYFTGLFTVIGITVGIILAVIMWKTKVLSAYSAFTLFLTAGLIIGWTWGAIKDKIVAKQGRQL